MKTEKPLTPETAPVPEKVKPKTEIGKQFKESMVAERKPSPLAKIEKYDFEADIPKKPIALPEPEKKAPVLRGGKRVAPTKTTYDFEEPVAKPETKAVKRPISTSKELKLLNERVKKGEVEITSSHSVWGPRALKTKDGSLEITHHGRFLGGGVSDNTYTFIKNGEEQFVTKDFGEVTKAFYDNLPTKKTKPKEPIIPKQKNTSDMTKDEFDTHWVKKTRGEVKKEVDIKIDEYKSDIDRLSKLIRKDPKNPANKNISQEISKLKKDIVGQRERLDKPIPKPSEFMSNAQYKYHKGDVELPPKTKISKGTYYFPTQKTARAWAEKSGWPTDRIIEYEKGYAVQSGKSGNYAGPDTTPKQFKGTTKHPKGGTTLYSGVPIHEAIKASKALGKLYEDHIGTPLWRVKRAFKKKMEKTYFSNLMNCYETLDRLTKYHNDYLRFERQGKLSEAQYNKGKYDALRELFK